LAGILLSVAIVGSAGAEKPPAIPELDLTAACEPRTSVQFDIRHLMEDELHLRVKNAAKIEFWDAQDTDLGFCRVTTESQVDPNQYQDFTVKLTEEPCASLFGRAAYSIHLQAFPVSGGPNHPCIASVALPKQLKDIPSMRLERQTIELGELRYSAGAPDDLNGAICVGNRWYGIDPAAGGIFSLDPADNDDSKLIAALGDALDDGESVPIRTWVAGQEAKSRVYELKDETAGEGASGGSDGGGTAEYDASDFTTWCRGQAEASLGFWSRFPRWGGDALTYGLTEVADAEAVAGGRRARTGRLPPKKPRKQSFPRKKLPTRKLGRESTEIQDIEDLPYVLCLDWDPHGQLRWQLREFGYGIDLEELVRPEEPPTKPVVVVPKQGAAAGTAPAADSTDQAASPANSGKAPAEVADPQNMLHSRATWPWLERFRFIDLRMRNMPSSADHLVEISFGGEVSQGWLDEYDGTDAADGGAAAVAGDKGATPTDDSAPNVLFAPRQPGLAELTITYSEVVGSGVNRQKKSMRIDTIELVVLRSFAGSLRFGVAFGITRAQTDWGVQRIDGATGVVVKEGARYFEPEFVLGFAPFFERGGRAYYPRRNRVRGAPYFGVGIVGPADEPGAPVPVGFLRSFYVGAEVEFTRGFSIALAGMLKRGAILSGVEQDEMLDWTEGAAQPDITRPFPYLGVALVVNLSPVYFEAVKQHMADYPGKEGDGE